MEKSKEMELLEELFDVDAGTLKPETQLKDIESWDSMTKLSLIAMIDEECDKVLNGAEINKLVTINDILKYME